MVHWVYVLECEDDYIYVGETKRLFRRFSEHLKSRGGFNTIKHKPHKLIGLYRVCANHSFMKYRNSIRSGEYDRFILEKWEDEGDNLLIENHITERLFYERRNNHEYGTGNEWYRIRGGKYTRETLDDDMYYAKLLCERPNRIPDSLKMSTPIDYIPENSIVDRPLCNCNYPSEVKLSKDKTKIYFVCALKNVWGNLFSDLEIDEPCDFWQLYTEDRDVKAQYELVKKRSSESWILNIPESKYKIHPESCISCNKIDYLAIFNMGTRRLCQPCIIHKYDDLKEKYHRMCRIIDI
jgi:predicted GIY-YIG superfamily endonuclease